MPDNSNSSMPIKGMNTDLHSIYLTEKGYDFALNATIETFDGDGMPVLQNEPSNLLCTGYIGTLLGYKTIYELGITVLFLHNGQDCPNQEVTISYIKSESKKQEVENISDGCDDCNPSYDLPELMNSAECKIVEIVKIPCLCITSKEPIDIEYRLTNCSLDLFWAQKGELRKYVYIDRETLKVDDFFYERKLISEGCYEITDKLDCNRFNVNACLAKPCVEYVDVISGGNTQAGMYQFFVAYAASSTEQYSDYTPASNPIPLRSRELTLDYDYNTGKAIVLDIKNLSNTFDFYNLAVAKTIMGNTSFDLVGTFSTAQSKVTYTGQFTQELTETEIYTSYASYRSATNVTKANNILFWSNALQYQKLNLQQAINRVNVLWATVAIKESVYKNPVFNAKYKSYERDEVYSLGVIIEYCDHVDETVFPLIGRSARPSDLVDISVHNDTVDCSTCNLPVKKYKWQVHNTATVLNTFSNDLTTQDCDAEIYQIGEFAYWESETRYPDDKAIWGDMACKPIQHFKMPDSCVSHIHDGKDANYNYEQDNIVYPLGVVIDHVSMQEALKWAVTQGLIKQEQYDSITGYRVVRSDRIGNRGIIAKGLLYDVWKYNKFDEDVYYSNYSFNDLRPDKYISNTDKTYEEYQKDTPKDSWLQKHTREGRYVFHSPDTHFTNNSIPSCAELKLETEEYGTAEIFFNQVEDHAKYKLTSDFAHIIAFGIGLAAAITATEGEDCTVVKIKSPEENTQGHVEVIKGKATSKKDSSASATPQADDGTFDGSISSKATDFSVVPPNVSKTITNYNLGDIRYNKGTTTNTTDTQPASGVDNTTGEDSEIIYGNQKFNNVSEIEKKYCRNTKWQNINNGGGLFGPILNVIGDIKIGKTNILGLMQRMIIGLQEMQLVLDTIMTFIPAKNYAIQYNAIGKYNNYKCVPEGFKIRKIETYSYLSPDSALTISDDNSYINFNNRFRESALYLKIPTDNLFQNPSVQDQSRVLLNEADCTLNKKIYRPVSSYYASIKQFLPNQYGSIDSVRYLETHCSFKIRDTQTRNYALAFGGDKFITRFALKRKHSFFLQTAFGWADQTDIKYSELGNVGYPNYFFNVREAFFEKYASKNGLDILAAITDPIGLLGVPRTRLQCNGSGVTFYKKGYMYLYSYGIPYYLVESDVNTDYRYALNDNTLDHYPRNKNLGTWLQEKNTPIIADNAYNYDATFSLNNNITRAIPLTANYDTRDCTYETINRVIYSGGISESQIDYSKYADNWRIYKALDKNDFPVTKGKLITIEGIENDKMLVRFENGLQVFGAYVQIPVDDNNIQITSGGLFKTKPQDYANTDLGYAGTQHRAIVNCEYGHFWVDAKRGQVFMLGVGGLGLTDISQLGMGNWFMENLPFRIKQDFDISDEDLDMCFINGLGISMCYDKRFTRVFITKLDYKVLDKTVKYDNVKKEFYKESNNIRLKIELTDTRFFCDKSWTLAYHVQAKSWISYYSFLPQGYISNYNYFQSFYNNSLWSHLLTNKSYQIFYGKKFPFKVQILSKTAETKVLNSIEFGTDVIRYYNEFDREYKYEITFNKAFITSDYQCTGNLNLVAYNNDDLSFEMGYPKIGSNATDILVMNSNYVWKFNEFTDLIKNRGYSIPHIIKNCANSDHEVNAKAMAYRKVDIDRDLMRDRFFKLMLINDLHYNYKISLKYVNFRTVKDFK